MFWGICFYEKTQVKTEGRQEWQGKCWQTSDFHLCVSGPPEQHSIATVIWWISAAWKLWEPHLDLGSQRTNTRSTKPAWGWQLFAFLLPHSGMQRHGFCPLWRTSCSKAAKQQGKTRLAIPNAVCKADSCLHEGQGLLSTFYNCLWPYLHLLCRLGARAWSKVLRPCLTVWVQGALVPCVKKPAHGLQGCSARQHTHSTWSS